jgi:hypothetical protein
MVRTSRCFAGTFLQLGGPDTLEGVERVLCKLHFTDFFFARFRLSFTPKFFVTSSNLEATSKCGSDAHDQKGESAAGLLAAC